MRFIMMGSGGVGGYFGARLAAAGHGVGFVARGAHLAAMKTAGLRVTSPCGDVTVSPVVAAEDPAVLGAADVIFVAVKLGDLKDALGRIAPAVGPATTVISLQNGVEAEDRLVAAFGPGRVAGGVAYIAAAVEAPGTIRHIGTNQRIEIGTLPGGEAVPVAAIVAALAEAGIDAAAVADIRHAIWRKFVFLVALSATTTLTGRTIGVVRADPHARALFADLMAEAAAVGGARGIPLADDIVADRLALTDTLPEAMTSSMAHDAAAGRPLEADWLSGAVVRMGRETGVPTPANNAAVAILALRRDAGR
ncbi:MAG: 2-dehydropantoate 2-reductase [Alphaproteobacteria bacterium]|nr:2-dehydropantoate 2-reductase [Alphaproteobacteria bacterium]